MDRVQMPPKIIQITWLFDFGLRIWSNRFVQDVTIWLDGQRFIRLLGGRA
jgi:hypothetical protein